MSTGSLVIIYIHVLLILSRKAYFCFYDRLVSLFRLLVSGLRVCQLHREMMFSHITAIDFDCDTDYIWGPSDLCVADNKR